jgi:hypothetical protein
MKWWMLGIALTLAPQPQAARRPVFVPSCIPTAPMPMAPIDTANVRRRYRLPIIRPDTDKLAPMPVDTRRPCYWDDSTRKNLQAVFPAPPNDELKPTAAPSTLVE